MPNPDDLNKNNNPNKNKEKEGKEFVSTNEPPSQKGINVELNYLTKGTKPVSVNAGKITESFAVGHSESKDNGFDLSSDWSTLKKEEALEKSTSGGLGGKLKSNHTSSNDLSGSLGTPPKDFIPKTPKTTMPPVEDAPEEVTESDSEQAKVSTSEGNDPPPTDTPTNTDSAGAKNEAPKEKKEPQKNAFSGILKEYMSVLNGSSEDDQGAVPTDSADEEGAKKVEEAQKSIVTTNPTQSTSTTTDKEGNTTSNGETTTVDKKNETSPQKNIKKDPEAEALAAFDIVETPEEEAQAEAEDKIKSAAKNRGLMVGRSIGYGAKITPSADGKFNIEKFSESGSADEEEKQKDKYNYENELIAKNMEQFGTEEKPAEGEKATPQEGYYNAYIEGYNEGHREGTALKAEAAEAERTKKMKEEQGSQEYTVGADLGMTCGTLAAQGKTQVDTKFTLEENGKYREVLVQTTVADLDDAGFNKKQTPGGELSGPVYEKAFLQYYNMGYRAAQNQRTKPPEIDENYKASYEQGYKLGTKRANGAEIEPELLAMETAFDAQDERELEKDEQQKHRGFYAGYNKGYAQVQAGKKNKAQAEREAKYKKPEFAAGYSTGNLKGFLTAMIEPSGIDLLTALNDATQMEAAGIPSYFPIPDALRKSIKTTLVLGDVAENENESDPTKALLGKPLFKEGLLMGYNQGYRQGQNSRMTFKRDKHKMHPDYQRSTLVLMESEDSTYKGMTESGEYKNGFTIGQILANAEFELNELRGKDSRSKEEEKRHKDLSKAVDALNGVVGKESKFYKLGVDEFSNWWMGELAKKAQKKKAEEGYSGAEGSPKRKGFSWGFEVGQKVIEGKEKLKELNRKGRDIKARSTQLNAAIKKSETKAKATSKQMGGEDYYIGYRNGYNHAFRLAKEGKKSDLGNLDTGKLLEEASQENARFINEIQGVITSVGIDAEGLKDGIGTAKKNLEGKTKEAFEAGLSRGYNSGYSLTVYDVKTGEKTTGNKTDEYHINEEYKKYQKVKGKDGKASDKQALGLLYFFLIGYQYHNKDEYSVNFGLPKGIHDAESFNLGYDAASAKFDSSKNSEKAAGKENKGKSKVAYENGYKAAEYQARYNKFKKRMIDSVVDNTENEGSGANNKGTTTEGGNLKNSTTGTHVTDKKESDTDVKKNEDNTPSKGGLLALAEKENVDLNKGKKEEGNNEIVDDFYKQGNEDATQLWTKIIYMRKGIKLEGANIEEEVSIITLENDKKETVLLTNSTDKKTINDYYGNQKKLIEGIANYYVDENYSTSVFLDLFSFNFSGLMNYEEEKEKARQNYIKGYEAKIASIESDYREKFMNDWLKDYGYYTGIIENAPEAKIEIPSAPYTQMSASEIDFDSASFKEGYLEGIRVGVLIKNGVLQPTDADLAQASGDDYNNGFEAGQTAGKQQGLVDAESPLAEPPKRKTLVLQLDKEYREQNGGVDDAMNYDYREAYVEAYFSVYWETRNYEYGRLLGYKRGAEGGDAMYDSTPEEGVRIDNEDAFFKGFDAGRSIAVSGLSEDALYQNGKSDKTPKTEASVITKITQEYAERNAAIDVLDELKLGENIILKITRSGDPYYERYKDLNTIKALGLDDQDASGSMGSILMPYEVEDLIVISDYLEESFNQYLGVSFKELPSNERAAHWNTFQKSYEEAYGVAHANSLAEMTSVAMTVALDQRKSVGGMGGGMDNGLGGSGNAALDVLKELMFSGVEAFYLNDLLLLDMFYSLETKVKDVQYYIEEDLEAIEFNQALSEMVSEDDMKEDLEKLKQLEQELKDGNLSDGEFMSKQVSITTLKAEMKEKGMRQGQIQHDWQEAEAAAKEKIESIRKLMKDKLAFDTPLASNDDILEYIKINLESSKGNKEDVYEDIDIFNDLSLKGIFNYNEAGKTNVSVQGNGFLHLDEYAENIDLDNVNTRIEGNGFQITAQGLSYAQSENELIFWGGSIVTPKIEGGEHAGEQYKYHFVDFSVNLSQGVQSQLDHQKHQLRGGPIQK